MLALFLCLFSFATTFAFGRVFLLYDSLLSARELAEQIETVRTEGDVIVQFGDYDQGLPFYLKQRIVLVNYMGELEFGALQEADPSWFLNGEGFAALWESGQRLLLIIDQEHEAHVTELLKEPLPEPAVRTEDRLVFVHW